MSIVAGRDELPFRSAGDAGMVRGSQIPGSMHS